MTSNPTQPRSSATRARSLRIGAPSPSRRATPASRTARGVSSGKYTLFFLPSSNVNSVPCCRDLLRPVADVLVRRRIGDDGRRLHHGGNRPREDRDLHLRRREVQQADGHGRREHEGRRQRRPRRRLRPRLHRRRRHAARALNGKKD